MIHRLAQILLIGLVALSPLSQAATKNTNTPINQIVMKVNDEIVTQSEYQSHLNNLRQYLESTNQPFTEKSLQELANKNLVEQ